MMSDFEERTRRGRRGRPPSTLAGAHGASTPAPEAKRRAWAVRRTGVGAGRSGKAVGVAGARVLLLCLWATATVVCGQEAPALAERSISTAAALLEAVDNSSVVTITLLKIGSPYVFDEQDPRPSAVGGLTALLLTRNVTLQAEAGSANGSVVIVVRLGFGGVAPGGALGINTETGVFT